MGWPVSSWSLILWPHSSGPLGSASCFHYALDLASWIEGFMGGIPYVAQMNPANPSAAGRAQLMEHVVNLFDKAK